MPERTGLIPTPIGSSTSVSSSSVKPSAPKAPSKGGQVSKKGYKKAHVSFKRKKSISKDKDLTYFELGEKEFENQHD